MRYVSIASNLISLSDILTSIRADCSSRFDSIIVVLEDYVLEMYPSSRYHESYDTQRAIIFTLLLALIFFLTAVVFFVFVVYVQKRQEKVMMSAIQTNKIVSSLFPSNVRDRMIDEAKQSQALEVKRANFVANKDQDIVDDTNVFSSKPIADLFPETTVMVRQNL